MTLTEGISETIKAVFLDIDGTLLDPNHVLSTENIQAIIEIQDFYSIPVYLVSARPPSGIQEYHTLLKLNTPFNAYNGALMGQYRGGNEFEPIRNLMIPTFCIEDIIQESIAYPFTLCIYEGNSLYAKDINNVHAQREKRLTHCSLETLDKNILNQGWEINHTGPHKIQCIGSYDEVNPFLELILKKPYSSQLHISQSGQLNFEITHFQATKDSAVRYLARETHITMEDILAIGDNFNDIAMLNSVGLGIVMGNAPEEILNQVKIHTSTNTDNGVAHALKKYFPKLSR